MEKVKGEGRSLKEKNEGVTFPARTRTRIGREFLPQGAQRLPQRAQRLDYQRFHHRVTESQRRDCVNSSSLEDDKKC